MQRYVAGPERVLGKVSRVQWSWLFARGVGATVPARRTPGQTAGVRLLLRLEFCLWTLEKHDSFAPEPPVDDLSTSRGVVLSRAATILRSIETQPSTGGSSTGQRDRGPPLPHRGSVGHAKKAKNVRGGSFLFVSFFNVIFPLECTGGKSVFFRVQDSFGCHFVTDAEAIRTCLDDEVLLDMPLLPCSVSSSVTICQSGPLKFLV